MRRKIDYCVLDRIENKNGGMGFEINPMDFLNDDKYLIGPIRNQQNIF